MSWNCYKITLEAKSPIHIGYGAKLGIVAKTRYYILAKHVWAALTNVLAQKHNEDYKIVGDALKKHARFSYFYIKQGDMIFAPQYTDSEGLKFGNLSVEAFEQQFISSFGATAMEKTQKSAEDTSLHEVEFIKPFTMGKPVLFEGYLFFDSKQIQMGSKSLDVSQLKGLEIQVGGERSYGFGKVKIMDIAETTTVFDDFEAKLNNEPALKIKQDKNEFYACAHVMTEGASDIIKNISGDLEPLVGRDWCKKRGGAGRFITRAEICYVPGTQITFNQPVRLKITKDGLWALSVP